MLQVCYRLPWSFISYKRSINYDKVPCHTTGGSDDSSEGRKTKGESLRRYDRVKYTQKHEEGKDADWQQNKLWEAVLKCVVSVFNWQIAHSITSFECILNCILLIIYNFEWMFFLCPIDYQVLLGFISDISVRSPCGYA